MRARTGNGKDRIDKKDDPQTEMKGADVADPGLTDAQVVADS